MGVAVKCVWIRSNNEDTDMSLTVDHLRSLFSQRLVEASRNPRKNIKQRVGSEDPDDEEEDSECTLVIEVSPSENVLIKQVRIFSKTQIMNPNKIISVPSISNRLFMFRLVAHNFVD